MGKLFSDSLYSRAFYKTGNKETAEDLVQDTFLAAFKAVEKFENRSQVKTWLFSILNNKISDFYRSKYNLPVKVEMDIIENTFASDGNWQDSERPKSWGLDSSSLLDDIEFNKTLQYCLENLPQSWNAAVQLKYLSEKKAALICQELEISPTNFWQIIHRAKLQLRKCLEKNWFNK